jgi:hypothetical protein
MLDILSENSKKEYPNSKVSYRVLKARGKKRFVPGVCYFINEIPKFI